MYTDSTVMVSVLSAASMVLVMMDCMMAVISISYLTGRLLSFSTQTLIGRSPRSVSMDCAVSASTPKLEN